MAALNRRQNRLAAETSPYLQQHADNPVDWYPWGEEALARARDEDRPILLSIGYSACHWCHVMAHESFADEATATLMNRYFVNIKVDREERPDIDKIYQSAQHLLTGRTGGWPLTMFLTPADQVPFFGGTYFPPTPRHGLPGFGELLNRIHALYDNRRDDISEQNAAFLTALAQSSPALKASEQTVPDLAPVVACIEKLQGAFDRQHGGFGAAPKFPHPSNLTLLLQCQRLKLAEQTRQTARTMCLLTLERMAAGGIYDHLAGGFCRYAVDAAWQIPHFEKMLYDNGPLLALYAEASQLDPNNPVFAAVVRETAAWVQQDMQAEQGGYYSSLDADSEGEEGRFYVWDRQELASLLDAQQFALFSQRYGLDRRPNFEGKWHLYASKTIAEVASGQDLTPESTHKALAQARQTVLKHRSQRPRPGRDEKILTAWNAMMITGMAIAARQCVHESTRDSYLHSAEAALAFIHETLWQNQRLLATCKDGTAHLNAYLDDYAFTIEAILAVLAVRWNTRWLNFAIALAEVLLAQFHAQENGGFFFTSHDHERLLQRRKDFMDDALPAGNGIAALGLLRLAHLTGNPAYMQAAEKTIAAASPLLQRAPAACTAMVCALIEFHRPLASVIIRADEATQQTWWQAIYAHGGLHVQCYAIPADSPPLPGLLAEKQALHDQPTAYICTGFTCLAPAHDLNSILTALDSLN